MADERDRRIEQGSERRWSSVRQDDVGYEPAASPEVERRVEERRVVTEQVPEDRRVVQRRADQEAALARRRHVVARVTQGLDYVIYLLYGLLAVRFMLALLGASQSAGFVQFINGITQPFYSPFVGIVARPAVNGGVLDFPLVIAVLAYGLLHLAIRGMLRLAADGRPAS